MAEASSRRAVNPVATGILVLAALYFARSILMPLAFSLFVIALAWPIQAALQRRIPRLAALLITLLLIVLVIVVVGSAIVWGLGELSQWLFYNTSQLQATYAHWVDWLENRHRRVAGESIPLWPLVYHDAAFCARYTDDPTAPETPESPAPRWLADMLWGYALLWNLSAASWSANKRPFLHLQFLDEWHRRVGSAEMLSHRYCSEDYQVEETVFSSGDTLLVNFSSQPRVIDGIPIPAQGYALVRE